MSKMDPNTYDKREVPCPACGAKAGSYCMRPSGHSGPFVDPHSARTKAAHEAWTKEEIAKYGEIRSDFLREANGKQSRRKPTTAPASEHTADQLGLF